MVDQTYKYKIRPHHLLCILGFRGYGYNKNFIFNMTRIVEELRTNPDTIIFISQQADDLCAPCPHNNRGVCVKKPDSEEIVQNLDSQYLKLLQIPLEVPISTSEVWDVVASSITLKSMKKICKKCEWWSYGYCSEGLTQLKNKF
jgi:hypothetical protein